MWIFNFFTLLIALTAIILAVVQFVTRHRPFVGIGNAHTAGTNALVIELFLKNWGEVPAENIKVDAEIANMNPSKQGVTYEALESQYLDLLFPTQETNIYIGVTREQAPSFPYVVLKATLAYTSRPNFKLDSLKLGRFSNTQFIAFDNTHFVTISRRDVVERMKIPPI